MSGELVDRIQELLLINTKLENRIKVLEADKARSTGGIVIEILEMCGMDGQTARAKFWHALSMQRIDLDDKLRVYKVIKDDE